MASQLRGLPFRQNREKSCGKQIIAMGRNLMLLKGGGIGAKHKAANRGPSRGAVSAKPKGGRGTLGAH